MVEGQLSWEAFNCEHEQATHIHSRINRCFDSQLNKLSAKKAGTSLLVFQSQRFSLFYFSCHILKLIIFDIFYFVSYSQTVLSSLIP